MNLTAIRRWRNGWFKEWKGVLAYFFIAALLLVVLWSNAVERGNAAEQLGQTTKQLEQVATETHNALCTFTADLQGRYDSTVRFLAHHAGHEPIPGVTRASILRSLENQKATLVALEELKCEPPVKS